MPVPLHRILVVAATERELALPAGWRTLCCGVGPVEAAAATAAAIATDRPAAIVHVGIAGARRERRLAAGTLVIGSQSRYHDLAVPARLAPGAVRTDAAMVAALTAAFPEALALPIGTSGRIGGTTDTDIEAMEGFAVLRAAQLAGVPAVEVRSISNDIEEDDRAHWHFEDAFTAITAATPRLVAEVAQCVS